MRKAKIVHLLFFILLGQQSFILATDCCLLSLEKARKLNWDRSPIVFYGIKLKSIDGNKSELRILENFKGDTDSTETVLIKSLYEPRVDERCLIYGKRNSSNLIEVDECSISRGFENPVNIIIHKIPNPPNPEKYLKDSIRWERQLVSLKHNATIELIEEIGSLRQEKNNSKINSTKLMLNGIIVLLLIMILWNFLLTYRIRKLKKKLISDKVIY